ncbi:YdeI/OmpD-associated family protein [Duganella sp. BJB1802]|uniref:YdeI/OmpD-associated family protein n=1 Tax=unclassified Duganella TaxID=2636909 RepID=UPI001593CA19|nr:MULTISPECIES: DUF1801 domain-containing protein [unclassified Duganella]NVD69917.1 YdeI/OmpD-associated family protein [Duganella sp. BJB1802]
MTEKTLNPRVDAYVGKPGTWQDAFKKLRAIALDCDLAEDFKWGHPCYTLDDQNIVLMHGFKEYCALLFFKGALMQDPKSILIQQTENVQAGRQIRFTSADEIAKMASTLKSYIREAIKVERSGAQVAFKKTAEFAMPEEFLNQLEESPELQEAFAALTPGRQRGYLLHFSSAKQAKTRESRVAKCVPHILKGKGLDDL